MLFLDNNAFGKQIAETLSNGQQAVIRVRGTSMYPFIRDYIDLVTLRAPRPEQLTRGQIVFFRYGSRYMLHRIIRQVDGIFHIRGDNRRDLSCEQVSAEHIIGYVVSIHRNGRWIRCDHWLSRLYAGVWITTAPCRLRLYPAFRRFRAFLSRLTKSTPKHVY